jgi:hypothetical protein
LRWANYRKRGEGGLAQVKAGEEHRPSAAENGHSDFIGQRIVRSHRHKGVGFKGISECVDGADIVVAVVLSHPLVAFLAVFCPKRRNIDAFSG